MFDGPVTGKVEHVRGQEELFQLGHIHGVYVDKMVTETQTCAHHLEYGEHNGRYLVLFSFPLLYAEVGLCVLLLKLSDHHDNRMSQ